MRSAGALVSLAAAGVPDAMAGDGKNKRKRRKRKKKQKSPATCAEQCPAPCHNCFHRPVGPPLCGNGGQSFCARPCLSDSDGIGTTSPYCYTGYTDRLTNAFTAPDCVNGNTSICINITPCG